jgi:hypothetical protein
MGILYIIYKRDVSKRFIKNLCERNVRKTWSTNQDHIGLRLEIRVSILRNVYSKTKNMSSNVNNISLANKWTDKMVKQDIKAVPMLLYQSCAEQLGNVITSCIVYV